MLTDADIIAHARALWPAVTVDAASDAFLLARLPGLRRRVSLVDLGEDYDDALAHLLAHTAYRVDPGGTFGTGPLPGRLTSVHTGALSASFAPGADVGEYGYTAPGLAYLDLIGDLGHRLPMMVCL